MNFVSLEFIAFISILMIIYYIFPKKYRWFILLLASLRFYYLFSGTLIVCLITMTLITYISSHLISNIKETKLKKVSLVSSILVLLSFLVVLKYNNFFAELLNPLFNGKVFNIPFESFVLPIGISYYTLDMIGYIVDIYRGKYKLEVNPLKLLTFFSYFPKIVEGPFCKYDVVSPSLFGEHKFDYDKFKGAFVLIAFGFIKKLVIADRLGIYVNYIFDNNVTGIYLINGIIAYALQIYFDFSGCINIVNGTSELFGIDLPENFKRPFFSKTISEFWRRWHITLGTWLKEYIFYPISFSNLNMTLTKLVRKLKHRYIFNFLLTAFPLFFVWLVNGLWHGPDLKYIYYGLYYYILMMIGMLFKPLIDKLLLEFGINTKTWSFNLLRILRTFIIVCFGLFLFRCASLTQFDYLTANMFIDYPLENLEVTGFTHIDLNVFLTYTLIIFAVEIAYEHGIDVRLKLNEQNVPVRWFVYLFLIFSSIIFGIYGVGYDASSFIYGGF